MDQPSSSRSIRASLTRSFGHGSSWALKRLGGSQKTYEQMNKGQSEVAFFALVVILGMVLIVKTPASTQSAARAFQAVQ